jgi:hypothetical protein
MIPVSAGGECALFDMGTSCLSHRGQHDEYKNCKHHIVLSEMGRDRCFLQIKIKAAGNHFYGMVCGIQIK